MDITRAIYLELYADFLELFQAKYCDEKLKSRIRLEDSPKVIWEAQFPAGPNKGKFIIKIDFRGKRRDIDYLYFYKLYRAFHKPIENKLAEGLLNNEHKQNQQKDPVILFPEEKEIDNISLCKVLKFLGYMPKETIISGTNDQAKEYLTVFFNREIKEKYSSDNEPPITYELDRSRYAEYVSKYDYETFQKIGLNANCSISDLDYLIENFFLTIGSNASVVSIKELWETLTEWYREFAFENIEDFIRKKVEFYPTESVNIVDRTNLNKGAVMVMIHVTELIPIIKSSSFGAMKTEKFQNNDIVKKKRGRIFEIKAVIIENNWMIDGIKERFSYLI